MSFRKYELGDYDEMRAAHRWDVPERYNIARDVCDKHDRDRLAMVWADWQGNERRVSFGELQDLSNRFANLLEAIGVERGDRVATLLPSLPETAAVFLGTYKRGAILLSMSILYGDEGIEHRLRDSRRTCCRHRQRQSPPHPRRPRRAGVRHGRVRGERRRRLRRDDGARLDGLRGGGHGGRRPGPALLLVGHHGARQGHPACPPVPARARGVRVLPRRARRRALPRLRRMGLGGRDLPAARPVALRGGRARPGAQGRIRPRGAPALPLEARRGEHVHDADRAPLDDRRGARGRALSARAAARDLLGRRAAQPRGDPLVPRAVRDHRARLLRAHGELPAVRQLPDRRGPRRARWDGSCRAGTSRSSTRTSSRWRPASAGRSACARARTRTTRSATGTAPRTARRSSAASGSTRRTRPPWTRTATSGTRAAPTT